MATLPQYDSLEYSVTSSGDFGQHLHVMIDANGELELAGAADTGIGFLTERGAEANFAAAVRTRHAPTNIGVASGAIAAGGEVFAAANGQVASTGTVRLGEAITAAAGAGSLVLFG